MAGQYDEEIWDRLKSWITNDYAVAGLMGNLFAESGLLPNNLENSKEAEIGYTDETYTQAVNDGTYTNFVDDACGYGLAQWTHSSRKQGLYNLKVNRDVSIDNLALQIDYLIVELNTTHTEVLTLIEASTSVREASDIVLIEFENPADQSEEVQLLRASYCQEYYNTYALGIDPDKPKHKFKLLLYEG